MLVRREKLVSSHISRLKARPRPLDVDPECLRWTPVVVTNTVVSDGEGEDRDDDEDEEVEEEAREEVTPLVFTGDGLEFRRWFSLTFFT